MAGIGEDVYYEVYCSEVLPLDNLKKDVIYDEILESQLIGATSGDFKNEDLAINLKYHKYDSEIYRRKESGPVFKSVFYDAELNDFKFKLEMITLYDTSRN